MKLQDLTETPQIIPPLDGNDIRDSISFCTKNINKAKEIETLDENVGLYLLEEPLGGYYFVYDGNKNELLYFVKFRKTDFAASIVPRSSIRQVLLWRKRVSVYSADMPRKIFWNFLYPKYKCLSSDSQQTTDGQRVWLNAVKFALDQGLKVRIANTNDSTFVDIKTKSEFDKNVDSTWGTTNWFQRMIVIIYE